MEEPSQVATPAGLRRSPHAVRGDQWKPKRGDRQASESPGGDDREVAGGDAGALG